MRYTVRHVTRFTYDAPITESVMEVRMQPRSDGGQHCLHFALATAPQTRVMVYQDHDGNTIHHFDVPGRHARLTLTVDAVVERREAEPLPERLDDGAWEGLDAVAASGECYEFLAPSAFARPTELLDAFRAELDLDRRLDPLTLLRRLSDAMRERFEYRPRSTRVDSPIDEALAARQGVCQDFAHIVIALARQVGIPTRYVSGYLFRDASAEDRSSPDATHAWVESYLPALGWVAFDPTNQLPVGERHIRVAVGRDYADVPPTRGVFKGVSAVRSELAVAVRVQSSGSPLAGEVVPFTPWMSREAGAPVEQPGTHEQQQQQQQQQ